MSMKCLYLLTVSEFTFKATFTGYLLACSWVSNLFLYEN